MTSQYVAQQRLRFGGQTLEPGDPVPIEKGRSYHQMLALGQIALAPTERASPPALPTDTNMFFVAHDGEMFGVVFKGAQIPDEADRVTLELAPGEQAALVLFKGDDEPSLVPLAALVPEQPTARLMAHLSAQVRAAVAARDAALAQPSPEQERDTTALRGQVTFLELLVRAIRTDGDALPEDFPALKDLHANGIATRQGLALLAVGEHGKTYLVGLDGIGAKRADQILAALAALGPPEASSLPPEG